MGTATIVSALGDGEYSVRVDAGKAHKDAEVARLQAQIATLESQIAGWQATLDAFAQYEEQPARDAVDAAQADYIEAMRTSPPPDAATVRALIAAHSKALQALAEVRARAALLRIQLDTWRLELAQARKDLVRWESLVVEFDVTAWCADYTPDASGEAGTLDIPGEFGPDGTTLVLAPREVPPTLPAGQIAAREVQSGAQAYLNAAILPGWQRHMPTYRAGRISNIDVTANRCSVELDEARSSAQDLEINQSSALINVPVRYMSCDAAAFEDGDHVIVEFQEQDWSKPVVIGFVERPRPCELLAIAVSSEEWRARGSPAEPEFDEALMPDRVRWAQLDPSTGELKYAGTDGDLYAIGPWQSSFPSSCDGVVQIAEWWYACAQVKQYDSPMAFNGKAWMRRTRNLDGTTNEFVAHDGETWAPPVDLYAAATAGRYIVAAKQSDDRTLVVIDPVARAVVREWTSDAYIYDVAAYGHLAAMRTEREADGWKPHVRVIDITTGDVIFNRPFATEVVTLADIAISSKHLAVLVIYSPDTWRIELHNLSTGELVDSIPNYGIRAITMTNRWLVGVLASGDIGAQQGTPGGGVDVYRVTDEGLSYYTTHYPFPADGDQAMGYAG